MSKRKAPNYRTEMQGLYSKAWRIRHRRSRSRSRSPNAIERLPRMISSRLQMSRLPSEREFPLAAEAPGLAQIGN